MANVSKRISNIIPGFGLGSHRQATGVYSTNGEVSSSSGGNVKQHLLQEDESTDMYPGTSVKLPHGIIKYIFCVICQIIYIYIVMLWFITSIIITKCKE